MMWEVGGMFKREGIYIHLWLIHVDVWQKPTQYCKVIILQLKIQKRRGTEGMGVYHKKGEKKERKSGKKKLAGKRKMKRLIRKKILILGNMKH